jgi:hypothetical protein
LGLAVLAGCVSPNAALQGQTTALRGLLQEAQSVDIASTLANPTTLNFPVKLTVMPVDYNGAFKYEDTTKAIADLRAALSARPDLVKKADVVPAAMLTGLSNLKTLRQLASSFGYDTVVIVSGENQALQASSLSVNLFDSWAGKSYWEAHTQVTALTLNVATGRLLAPVQAAAKAGPDVLNADDKSAAGPLYALQKKAESAAWVDLRKSVVNALDAAKHAQDEASAAAPSASGTPSPQAAP